MGKINLDVITNYYNIVSNGDKAKKKIKIYFTCHPDDFDKYFENIKEDFFDLIECSIYYKKDMSFVIEKNSKKCDLSNMNLFVIPVTKKLLTEHNAAIEEFKFLKQYNISTPVLPLMMESDLDSLYSDENLFGSLHYLSPIINDQTSISYKEKLKKYFSSIFLNEKTINLIKKEFNAYIFLSYRKKDRYYANELMKLIHSNPMYRDIAIWFDEFLIPGEKFDKEIEDALKACDFFTMLVTPNLVNEKNYVQSIEYPFAIKCEKNILPVEFIKTNKSKLSNLYINIPKCVNAKNKIELSNGILKGLENVNLCLNNEKPKHCYLIGLAYLHGIDVEINSLNAIKLITYAAENNYLPAMNKAYDIYFNGLFTKIDYYKAAYWAYKIYKYYLEKEGENSRKTLKWLFNLSESYFFLNDYKKALIFSNKCYEISLENFGKKDKDTILYLNSLIKIYFKLNDYEKINILIQKTYDLTNNMKISNYYLLNTLVLININNGKLKDALKLSLKIHKYNLKKGKNIEIINSLYNISSIYYKMNDNKGLDFIEEAYNKSIKINGEKHPQTIKILRMLFLFYANVGNYDKAFELGEKAYNLTSRLYKKESKETLALFNDLVTLFSKYEDSEMALYFEKEIYFIKLSLNKDNNLEIIKSLDKLANKNLELGEFEETFWYRYKLYNLDCEFDEEHYWNLNRLIR